MPIPVEVRRRGKSARTDYATNLSPGGLCLHLRQPLPVGEALLLSLELPDRPGRIELRGRVTWSDSPEPEEAARFFEAGVRIEVLGEEDRQRIEHFVGLCDPGDH